MSGSEHIGSAKPCSETGSRIYLPDGDLFMQLMNPKNPRNYVKVDSDVENLPPGGRRKLMTDFSLRRHKLDLLSQASDAALERLKNGPPRILLPPPKSDSPEDIHNQFVHDLAATCFWVNYEMNGKKMDCILAEPKWGLDRSWRISGPESRLRYFLRDPKNGKLRRIRACRVFFITTDGYLKSDIMNVSFLCQNTWCLNPEHMVMELHHESAQRDKCPGNDACNNKVKCLQPGIDFGCDEDIEFEDE